MLLLLHSVTDTVRIKDTSVHIHKDGCVQAFTNCWDRNEVMFSWLLYLQRSFVFFYKLFVLLSLYFSKNLITKSKRSFSILPNSSKFIWYQKHARFYECITWHLMVLKAEFIPIKWLTKMEEWVSSKVESIYLNLSVVAHKSHQNWHFSQKDLPKCHFWSNLVMD